jgi:predicted nucleotidyltransferase
MKPSQTLQSHRSEIRRLVEANGACNARIFGSVLRGLDTDASDLDLLVDPIDGRTTLMRLVRIKQQVEELTGAPVDVVTPMALPEQFRSQVLAEAKPL